jgi:ribosome-associated protein
VSQQTGEWFIDNATWDGSVESLKDCIIHSLEEDKAEQISVIDLKGKTSFADMMIIADGRSARHVASLSDSLIDVLKDIGNPHISIEGKETCDWVLLDAGDIVVHLFRPGVREIYNLEKMWAVAPMDSPLTDTQLITN